VLYTAAGLVTPLRGQQPPKPAGPAACLIIGEWQASRNPKVTLLKVRSDGYGGFVLQGKREWTGKYDPASGRLDLSYNLSAVEIQEAEDKGEVPQWARDQVAGKAIQEHMNLTIANSGGAANALSMAGEMYGEKVTFIDGQAPKIVAGDKKSLGDSYTRSPGIYKSALCRAMQADGKSVDDALTTGVGDKITNYALLEAFFKQSPLARLLVTIAAGDDPGKGPVRYTTTITLGNHGAMLVLRDAFLERMQQEKAKLAGIDGDDSMTVMGILGALKQAIKAGSAGLGAIGQVRVTNPKFDPKSMNFSDIAIPLENLLLDQKMDPFLERKIDRFSSCEQENGIREAIPKFKKAVDYSLAKAQNTQDDDVLGLLEITGNHFERVVDSIVPKMLEPAGSGQADQLGQAQVKAIPTLFDQVQAQKSYAELDTEVSIALVLAASPLFGLEASVAVNTTMLVHGGHQLASC